MMSSVIRWAHKKGGERRSLSPGQSFSIRPVDSFWSSLVWQRRGVPDHELAAAQHGQAVAILAEGKAAAYPAGRGEREQFVAGVRVPHHHHAVIGNASQSLAVRAEGEATDWAAVALKNKRFLSGPGIPHNDLR